MKKVRKVKKGDKGDKGEQGIQGIQGIQGAQGEKGDKGADGVSVTGVTINEDNKLVITLSEGDPIIIDKSVVGADGKNGNGISKVTLTEDFCLVFDYTDGTSSDKIGPIKGADGANGADGLTPILTLDDEGDLSVKYGENGEVTLLGNIKGIKGDKGDKGVDGKSAYELYIAAHPEYTGTQEEWLAALKGEKGDTGRGIADIAYSNNKLTITYTDNTKQVIDLKIDSGGVDITDYFIYSILPDETYGIMAGELAKYASVLTIPSTHNDIPVTQILDNGFSNLELLQKVSLPDSIIKINDNAFENCILLNSVNLPQNLTTLGSYSFSNCAGLTEITIPESVETIKSYAFYKSGIEKLILENTNWNISNMPKLISKNYMPNYPRNEERAQIYDGKFDFENQ